MPEDITRPTTLDEFERLHPGALVKAREDFLNGNTSAWKKINDYIDYNNDNPDRALTMSEFDRGVRRPDPMDKILEGVNKGIVARREEEQKEKEEEAKKQQEEREKQKEAEKQQEEYNSFDSFKERIKNRVQKGEEFEKNWEESLNNPEVKKIADSIKRKKTIENSISNYEGSKYEELSLVSDVVGKNIKGELIGAGYNPGTPIFKKTYLKKYNAYKEAKKKVKEIEGKSIAGQIVKSQHEFLNIKSSKELHDWATKKLREKYAKQNHLDFNSPVVQNYWPSTDALDKLTDEYREKHGDPILTGMTPWGAFTDKENIDRYGYVGGGLMNIVSTLIAVPASIYDAAAHVYHTGASAVKGTYNSSVMNSSWGLSDEQEAQLAKSKALVAQYEMPAVDEIKGTLSIYLNEDLKRMGISPVEGEITQKNIDNLLDNDNLNYKQKRVIQNYEEAFDNVNYGIDYLKGSGWTNFWEGMGSKAQSSAILHIRQFLTANDITDKLRNKVPLTDDEKMFMRSLRLNELSKARLISDSQAFQVGETVTQSSVMAAEMALTKGLGKVIGSAGRVALRRGNALAEELGALGKVAGKTLTKGASRAAYITGTATTMPETWQGASQEYRGNIQFYTKIGEDGNREIVLKGTDKGKLKFAKRLQNDVNNMKLKIKKVRERVSNFNQATATETEKEQYKNDLYKISNLVKSYQQNMDIISSLVDENGNVKFKQKEFWTDIAPKQISQQMNEVFTEVAVGQKLDDMLKVFGKSLKKIAKGSKLHDSEAYKLAKEALVNGEKVSRKLKILYGTGKLGKAVIGKTKKSREIIQGIIPETGEEVIGNLLPVYGQTDKESAQSAASLGDPNFYWNTLSSIGLMSGTMGTAGYFWNRRLDRKLDRKAEATAKDFYHHLDKNVTREEARVIAALHPEVKISPEDAEAAKLATDLSEDLTEDDKKLIKDNIGKKQITDFVTTAVLNGVPKERFNAIIEKIKSNAESEEMKQYAEDAKTYFEELHKTARKQSEFNNGHKVVGLKSALRHLNNQLKWLKEGKGDYNGQVSEMLENFNRSNKDLEDITMEDLEDAMYGQKVKVNVIPALKKFYEENEDSKVLAKKAMFGNTIKSTEKQIKDTQKTLDYETNSANKEEIKKRQKDITIKQAKASVTENNAKVIKKSLKNRGIDDASLMKQIEELEKEAQLKSKSRKKEQAKEKKEYNKQKKKIRKSAIETSVKKDSKTAAKNFRGKSKDNIPKTEAKPDESLSKPENKPSNKKVKKSSTKGSKKETSKEETFKEKYEKGISKLSEEEKRAKAFTSNEEDEADVNWAPVVRDEKDEEQNNYKNSFKAFIKHYFKENPNRSGMTFEDFLHGITDADIVSKTDANTLINIMADAWNEARTNTVSQADIDEIHENIFGTDSMKRAMESFKGSIPTSTPETFEATGTPSENTNTSGTTSDGLSATGLPQINEVSEKEVEMTSTGKVVPYRFENKAKYQDIGLKAGGFLLQNYGLDENGDPITTDGKLNPRALPFLDWRNFDPKNPNKNSVDITFDFDYILNGNNPMSTWDYDNPREREVPGGIDKRPRKVPTTTVEEVMTNIFKGKSWKEIREAIEELKRTGDYENNPLYENKKEFSKFLEIIPTATINNGLTESIPQGDLIPGGIPTTDWFNPTNVGLRVYEVEKEDGTVETVPTFKERRDRINKNRAMNFTARLAILNGKNFTHTLTVAGRKLNIKNKTTAINNSSQPNTIKSQFINPETGELDMEGKAALVYVDKDMNLMMKGKDGKLVPAKLKNGKGEWVLATKKNTTNYGGSYNKVNNKGKILLLSREDGGKFVLNDVLNDLDHSEATQKLGKIANEVYFKLKDGIFNGSSKEYTDEQKTTARKNFRSLFGENKPGSLQQFEESYPTRNRNRKNPHKFAMDFKVSAQTETPSQVIPDLREFKNADEFIQALLTGKMADGSAIPTTTKDDILLNHLFVPINFTPIKNNGEYVYTPYAQTRIDFNTVEGEAPIITENRGEEISNLKKIIKEKEKRLKENHSKATKEILKEQKTKAEAKLKEEEDKQAQINAKNKFETEKVGSNTVQEGGSTSTEGAKSPSNNISVETGELTEEDKNLVAKSIVGKAIAVIDFSNDVTLKDVLKEVENQYNKLVNDLKDTPEGKLVKENRESILGEGGDISGSTREYLAAQLGIEEDLMADESPEAYRGKNFDQSSYEISAYNNINQLLRLALSGIPDTRKSKGFAGLRPLLTSVETTDAIQQIMADMGNNSLQEFIKVANEKYNRNPESLGFYQNIVKVLEDLHRSNPKLLNETFYKLFQNSVAMKFVLSSAPTSTSNRLLRVLDANSGNPVFKTRNKWVQSIKRSKILSLEGKSVYKVNEDVLAKAKKLYEELSKSIKDNGNRLPVENIGKIKELTNLLGIHLDDKLLNEITSKDAGNINAANIINSLISNKQSTIGVIIKNLETVSKNKDRKYSFRDSNRKDSTTLNPVTSNNGQLNDIIKANLIFQFVPAKSMYIGGKTIYSYQDDNAINHVVRGILKGIRNGDDVPKVIERLSQIPGNDNSFLLGLLANIAEDEDLKEHFGVFMASLEAFKEGTSRDMNRDVNKLPPGDYWHFMLGLLAKTEGEYKNSSSPNLKMKKGYAPFPPLSDSDQVPILKTILLELGEDNFVNLDSGHMGEELLDMLRSQLLEGDLNRIASYILNVEHQDKESQVNTKFYDKGVKFISGMPSLNSALVNVNIDGENYTRSLKWVFEHFVNTYENDNLSKALKTFNSSESSMKEREEAKRTFETEIINLVNNFVNQYKDDIDSRIEEDIKSKVDKLTGEEGVFRKYGLSNKEGTQMKVSSAKGRGDYFSEKSPVLVAYDYVINSLISGNDIQRIFASDQAYYFKSELSKTLDSGLPAITFGDIVHYYYSNSTDAIKEIIGNTDLNNLSDEQKNELVDKFDLLKHAPEINRNNSEEGLDNSFYEDLQELLDVKVSKMFKEVENNISKRLKELISPGKKWIDMENQPDYIQIMVQDVENVATSIEDLIGHAYPELVEDEDFMKDLQEFVDLDLLDDRDIEDEKRRVELKKKIENEIPAIKGYLETASTDAQEIMTWGEYMDGLMASGQISQEDYFRVSSKLEAQSKDVEKYGEVQDKNKLSEEDKGIVFQPIKPLYSGRASKSVGMFEMNPQVYIKSSAFPLIPEMTQIFGGKLDKRRKVMEEVEKRTGKNVRLAYESAVKVGMVDNPVKINDLDMEDPSKMTEDELNFILNSSRQLKRSGYSIQQPIPYHHHEQNKKGQSEYINMLTQFEKILLGDGIGDLGDVFPEDFFDSNILKEAGISNEGDLTGEDLKKLYAHLMGSYEDVLRDSLFNELGIEKVGDFNSSNIEAIEKIHDLLLGRVSKKQDREAIDLLYFVRNENGSLTPLTRKEYKEQDKKAVKALPRSPLYMSPNSNKYESVLNSLITKQFAKLRLPGYHLTIGSQEGFSIDRYTPEMYNKLREKGAIFSRDFNPEKGLGPNEIIMSSRFSVLNEKTGERESVDMTEYVDDEGYIDTERLPDYLLDMFSARIPTSAHQSGSMIKIAALLPVNMGDLAIVSKNSTVQIGEDYDADARYTYQYHYVEDVNENGEKVLRKVDQSDLKDLEDKGIVLKPTTSVGTLKENFQNEIDKLWNEFFEEETRQTSLGEEDSRGIPKSPIYMANKETIAKIAMLKAVLEDKVEERMVYSMLGIESVAESANRSKEAIKEKIKELESRLFSEDLTNAIEQDYHREYEAFKKQLEEEFNKDKSELITAWKDYKTGVEYRETKKKVLENNLISMFRSVFKSESPEVKKLVTKELSTKFAEDTADAIDDKSSNDDRFFNIFDPVTKRRIRKAGAYGSIAIGGHSSLLTFNSILQQLDVPLQFFKEDADGNHTIPVSIRLGSLVFDGVMGKIKDETGTRASEYLMQSQNSATDNQKLGIMDRRNETPNTMGVLAFMQMALLEKEGSGLQLIDENGKESKHLSYASLFLSQPVIKEWTETVENANAASEDSGKSQDELVDDLTGKYVNRISSKYWATTKKGKPIPGVFSDKIKTELGKKATSKKLFENIGEPINSEEDAALQLYLLQQFQTFLSMYKEVNALQKVVNIEANGAGVSYFDDISGVQKLIKIISEKSAANTDSKYKLSSADGRQDVFQSLIGDYIFSDGSTISPETMEKEGYFAMTKSGDLPNDNILYVKPTTRAGHKIVNTLHTAYHLWGEFYPYSFSMVKGLTNRIMEETGINPDTKKGQETLYGIMATLKDFMYSNIPSLSKFPVKELFFNSNIKGSENESLANYLNSLMNDENFSYIFDKPLFKDLRTELSGPDYPSTILYENDDRTEATSLDINNTLLSMSKSNKELPTWNGRRMSEADLVEALLAYSMVANQDNGATGFRDLIPANVYDKYKIYDVLRSRTNTRSSVFSTITKGLLSSAQDITGNTINNEGIIKTNMSFEGVRDVVNTLNKRAQKLVGTNIFSITESGDIEYEGFEGKVFPEYNFVRQFIQHNPMMVKTKVRKSESVGSLYSIIKQTNNIVGNQLVQGKVNAFSIPETKKTLSIGNFITVIDENGEPMLYQKTGETPVIGDSTADQYYHYERVATLGATRFNEYNPYEAVNESKVKENNVDYTIESNNQTKKEELPKFATVKDVSTIMVDILNDMSSPLNAVINVFKPFIKSELGNMEVQVVDSGGRGKASMMVPLGGGPAVMRIDKNYLEGGPSIEDLRKTITEEVMHSVTKRAIDPYLTITDVSEDGVKWKQKGDNPIPSELSTLMSVYSYAVQQYAKTDQGREIIQEVKRRREENLNDENSPVGSEGDMEAYRMKDIHEFIVGLLFKDENFAKKMAKTKYRSSDKNVLRKMIDALAKFFNRILPNTRKDTVSAYAINALYTFLAKRGAEMERKERNTPKEKPKTPKEEEGEKEEINGDTSKHENVLKNLKGKDGVTVSYKRDGVNSKEYTIKGDKIFNTKGEEVFKQGVSSTEGDRRKIFLNLAVKLGTNNSKVVEVDDTKYVVNNKEAIYSTSTGKVLNYPENSGLRKRIMDKYKKPNEDPTNTENSDKITSAKYFNSLKQGDKIFLNGPEGIKEAIVRKVDKGLMGNEKMITVDKGSPYLLEGKHSYYVDANTGKVVDNLSIEGEGNVKVLVPTSSENFAPAFNLTVNENSIAKEYANFTPKQKESIGSLEDVINKYENVPFKLDAESFMEQLKCGV